MTKKISTDEKKRRKAEYEKDHSRLMELELIQKAKIELVNTVLRKIRQNDIPELARENTILPLLHKLISKIKKEQKRQGTRPVIENVLDYLNSKNLEALKKCDNYHTKAREFTHDIVRWERGRLVFVASEEMKGNGEIKKAIEQYQKYLKINIVNFDVFYEIGICYYALGRYNKSLKYLKKAKALRGGATIINEFLLKIFIKTKKWKVVTEMLNDDYIRIQDIKRRWGNNKINGTTYKFEYDKLVKIRKEIPKKYRKRFTKYTRP